MAVPKKKSLFQRNKRRYHKVSNVNIIEIKKLENTECPHVDLKTGFYNGKIPTFNF